MRKLLNKAMFGFDNVLMSISSFLLLISVILSVINAIARSLGMMGLIWADEVSVILVVVMVFLLQPFLEYSGKQLNIGFLDNLRLPYKVNIALEVFRGLVIIAVIGYLGYYTLSTIQLSMRFNFTTPVLQFPRSVLYMFMLASFILTIISWVIKIIGKIGRVDATISAAPVTAEEEAIMGTKAINHSEGEEVQ